jgi:acyl-coenzyme A synthetase/AMP-(fatty) acid ligase/thioesterase domain-containing protein/acyl carrier protein
MCRTVSYLQAMDALSCLANQSPKALFLSEGRRTFSFAEADTSVGVIAMLFSETVRPGELVVSLVDRGINAALLMLAAHRASLTIAFLDGSLPIDLLTPFVASIGASAVVRFDHHHLIDGIQNIALTDEQFQVRPTSQDNKLRSDDTTGELVVFSSGTTGSPKGVIRSVKNLIENGHGQTQRLSLAPSDHSGEQGSFRFVTPATTIYAALASGSSIDFPDPSVDLATNDVARWISDAGVTVLRLQAAIVRSFLERKLDLHHTALRMITVSGEPVFGEELIRFRSFLPPGCTIRVTYGSTEGGTIGHRNFAPTDAVSAGLIRFPNADCFVADEMLHPIQDDSVGEIVSRTAMSIGYWQRPTETDERFVTTDDGTALFRTGDFGRFVDGELEVIGRQDGRVKIRGYNVELVEVEAALFTHPHLRRAVVVAVDRTGGGQSLVAYFVPVYGHLPSAKQLRNYLATRLPSHKIPAKFVMVDKIATTAAGKIDRESLRLATVLDDDREIVPPANSLEVQLHNKITELLGLERLSCNDDFFDMGGDSLSAIELATWLSDTFDIPVNAATLGAHSTVLALANYLDAHAVDELAGSHHRNLLHSWNRRVQHRHGHRSHSVGILRDCESPANVAILVAGAGDNLLSLRRLTQLLPSTWKVLALGNGAEGCLERTMAGYTHRAADEILQACPTGQFILCGHSFGGVVAHGIATHLESAQRTVAAIVLLDTVPPRGAVTPDAAQRLRHCRFTIRRSLGRSVRAALAIGQEIDPRELLQKRKSRALEQEIRMLRAHTPKPCNASILLMRAQAGSWVRDEHIPVWEALTAGVVKTMWTAGTHGSLHTDPYIGPIASTISNFISTNDRWHTPAAHWGFHNVS